MVISVVIPCYYSEAMINKVVTMTRDELVRAGYQYEFILVNDGSTDGTFAEIKKLCEGDKNIVGVSCVKNFGQHSALMAGLRHASGDYALLMDDDMQTHPSQCLKVIDKTVAGDFDIVFASWAEHKEVWWRRLGSDFAAWSMQRLTDRPRDIYVSNFFVMSRFVYEEVARYTGPYVQIQGLALRATRNIANVEVEHFNREQGTSGYSMRSLIRMWATVLNFSMVPLRIASVMGPVIGLVGLAAAVVVSIQKILDPSMAAGWPSLMAVVLICSGLILIALGVLGEYLGRIFMIANSQPQYVVKEVIDNRPAKGKSSSEYA